MKQIFGFSLALTFIILGTSTAVQSNAFASDSASSGDTTSTTGAPSSTAGATTNSTRASGTPEAQRFYEYKKVKERENWVAYFADLKSDIEKHWQPRWAKSELEITKVEATLNAEGKCTQCTVTATCGNADRDNRVEDFVRSLRRGPLPNEAESLKFFLTFMTDGVTHLVEFSQSDASDKYYMDNFGFKVNLSNAFFSTAHDTPKAELDWGPYMANLQRKIKLGWFPPKGHETKRIVVAFKIRKDGSMSGLRLKPGCDVESANEAALAAVNNAAPFEPLPEQVKEDVDIQFTFDYNVFAASKKEPDSNGILRY